MGFFAAAEVVSTFNQPMMPFGQQVVGTPPVASPFTSDRPRRLSRIELDGRPRRDVRTRRPGLSPNRRLPQRCSTAASTKEGVMSDRVPVDGGELEYEVRKR